MHTPGTYPSETPSHENESSSFRESLQAITALRSLPAVNDILEVTYSYTVKHDASGAPARGADGHVLAYNDIFPAMTHISYEDIQGGENTFEEVWDKSENAINAYITHIHGLITRFEQTDMDEEKRATLIRMAESAIRILTLARLGLPFELEKAGYQSRLSEEEIQGRIDQMNVIQDEEFGLPVHQSPQGSLHALKNFRKKFHATKSSLSSEDREKKEILYEGIRTYLQKQFPQAEFPSLETPVVDEARNDTASWKHIQIPREVYVEIFRAAIALVGTEHDVQVNPNRSSIFDGEKALEVPASEAYATLSLERILLLISHEIMTHAVTQKNGEQFFEGARTRGNIEKDEGLAMFMEAITSGVSWQHAADRMRGISESRTLGAELLSSEELAEWTDLGKDEAMLRRISRNFPYGRGAQRKDLLYGNGLQKVVEYVEKGGDIKSLFSGKFGFEDIASGSFDFSRHPEILYPIFLSDIILYFLDERTKQGKKMNHHEFIQFLRDKYGSLLSSADYDRIPVLRFSQKKRVKQVLDMIGKYADLEK